MTEAIKQWAYQKSRDYANDKFPSGHVTAVAKTTEHHEAGLSKGIEIAEGFAEWAEDGPYLYNAEEKLWKTFTIGDPPITTSQLLEKYLEYLKTLEP